MRRKVRGRGEDRVWKWRKKRRLVERRVREGRKVRRTKTSRVVNRAGNVEGKMQREVGEKRA